MPETPGVYTIGDSGALKTRCGKLGRPNKWGPKKQDKPCVVNLWDGYSSDLS